MAVNIQSRRTLVLNARPNRSSHLRRGRSLLGGLILALVASVLLAVIIVRLYLWLKTKTVDLGMEHLVARVKEEVSITRAGAEELLGEARMGLRATMRAVVRALVRLLREVAAWADPAEEVVVRQ